MSTAWRTTSAPNRPPPSSGNDDRAVAPAGDPSPALCASCGQALAGPFCSACGQRDLPLNPSARHLVGEMWDEFASIDGKFLRTVRLLVTRPGALTAEYLRGRREPYLSPLKLYVTISAGYFAVLATTPTHLTPIPALAAADASERARMRAKMDALAAGHSRPVAAIVRGFPRAADDRLATSHAVEAALPRMLFVLVPLFAVFVQAAYRKRRLRYPAHLYFALHFFAFYFVVAALVRLLYAYAPGSIAEPVAVIIRVGIVGYLVLALKRQYGGRIGPTLARAAVIGATFGLSFVAVTLVVVSITLGWR